MNGSTKLTAAETVSIKKHMSKVESKFKELTNNKKLKLKLQYFNELQMIDILLMRNSFSPFHYLLPFKNSHIINVLQNHFAMKITKNISPSISRAKVNTQR